MSKQENSTREIWKKLDNGVEPETEREKEVAKMRDRFANKMAESLKAPLKKMQKLQKDWMDAFSKLIEYAKQHREEFDRRYEIFYPEMKAHLRNRLELKKDEEPMMPLSNDDMWEMWIKEIAPHALIGNQNLKRDDFIHYHNLIEESLYRIGIKNDLKTLAIEMTAKGKHEKCKEYLQQFVYREDRDLSANKFFKNHIDADGNSEAGKSTFLGWVKNYNENLKELRCAQKNEQ